MMDKETIERLYDLYGYGVRFDPFRSSITTQDLHEAVLVGHVRTLSYGSHKEGPYIEYEHEFQSLPALYQLGVPGGEEIEALLSTTDADLRDAIYFGDFLDLVYVDEEGDEYVIEGPGGLYIVPPTNLFLIETDAGEKFAIAGYLVDRWIKG
jgi:hypothetical protein